MTSRVKTWLTVSSTLTILFSLLYASLRIILLTSFADLEDKDVRRNVHRVLNAITTETDNLSATTHDWASWDDTYAFLSDQNQDYIESNLLDGTFVTLRLNLMLFIDTSGQIVFGKAFDLENEVTIPLMPGIEEHLIELQHQVERAGTVGGIIRFPQATMLVAAAPILTSQDAGPPRGTAIFGRELAASWVQELADSVRLELSIQEAAGAPSASESEPSTIVVQPLSQAVVAGYIATSDIHGKPALLIRVSMPRDIYQRGQTTLKYFGIILAGIGVLFGLVALILLEKNIQARARFQAIFDHSADAICLARPDGTIGHTNPAFNRIFGTQISNKTRPVLSDLIGAEPADQLLAAINTVRRSQLDERVQVVAHSKPSLAFNADISLSPIVGNNNRLSDIVCSIRDISRQKQSEHQLRRALVREIELNEMKSQFVSLASHELRTPLAVIQLASDALSIYRHKMSDEQKQRRLTTMQSAIQRMTELLENVLTLSRVESGQVQFNPTRLALEPYCQELLKTAMATKGHEHKSSFMASGNLTAACLDQRLLHHILDNLLSNALKYSPPGSTVHLEVVGEDSQVIFTVRDEGIGIPKQEQSHIFDMFYRGEGVSHISGTGLGLAIARQAVEVHGGSIAVDSVEGKGSTFTVVLPYVCSE